MGLTVAESGRENDGEAVMVEVSWAEERVRGNREETEKIKREVRAEPCRRRGKKRK